MMPGLLPNTLPGLASATPSSSRASERGLRGRFRKPFTERTPHPDEASAGHIPLSAKAVRLSHTAAAAPQAMRVQSRLNIPAAEAAKTGVCALDRWTSTGRKMPADCGLSRGSDHDPSSMCLAAMVNEFIESDSAHTERTYPRNATEGTMSDELAAISNSLESLARCTSDLEIKLLRDVQAVLEPSEGDVYQSVGACADRKRMVMSVLQKLGYDAAICKTRWDHANGLSGGEYEYIDILFASDSLVEPVRLLVDIEFQAQFKIARPASEFSAILQLIPPIFVGRLERLKQIVHVMAEATKRSLRIKGLHLPPWRKLNYMKAKWFSSYKRTSNPVPSNTSRKLQANDSVYGGGFACIAERGPYGSDTLHTNDLGMLYYGAKPLRDVDGRDANAWRDKLITVTTTNWQPPPLEVRSHSHTRSQSNVTGLASMLLRTDLPTCNEVAANAA